MHQRRRHRRIDAAAEGADDAAVAHLGADVGDGLLDEVGRRPVAAAAADLPHEVADQAVAVGRVHDFGVELDAVQALVVAHGGHGDRLAGGEHAEAGGRLGDAVAVAHPDGHRLGQLGQEVRLALVVDHGVAELPLATAGHATAQRGRHRLHAVADAQHGQPALVDVGRRRGRAVVVHRGRSARQDEALGVERPNALPGRRMRQQLAVDVEFPHAPRDQHARLGAEVHDHDRFARGCGLAAGGAVAVALARHLQIAGDFQVVGAADAFADRGGIGGGGQAGRIDPIGRGDGRRFGVDQGLPLPGRRRRADRRRTLPDGPDGLWRGGRSRAQGRCSARVYSGQEQLS